MLDIFINLHIIYTVKSLARYANVITNSLVSCDYFNLFCIGKLEQELFCFHLNIFLVVLLIERADWQLHL